MKFKVTNLQNSSSIHNQNDKVLVIKEVTNLQNSSSIHNELVVFQYICLVTNQVQSLIGFNFIRVIEKAPLELFHSNFTVH